ncbi:hypothetical protein JD79_03542 [Geodermatophilus normandii]|uniref:Uncharacterized protein n=1 Tax=Geodermatophilus normandii TaxID=1137989 RepID=A0A317QN07_9ACTN|nr:hypothetical protein JD79_03542 [Geodermatophilus normandii]
MVAVDRGHRAEGAGSAADGRGGADAGVLAESAALESSGAGTGAGPGCPAAC